MENLNFTTSIIDGESGLVIKRPCKKIVFTDNETGEELYTGTIFTSKQYDDRQFYYVPNVFHNWATTISDMGSAMKLLEGGYADSYDPIVSDTDLSSILLVKFIDEEFGMRIRSTTMQYISSLTTEWVIECVILKDNEHRVYWVNDNNEIVPDNSYTHLKFKDWESANTRLTKIYNEATKYANAWSSYTVTSEDHGTPNVLKLSDSSVIRILAFDLTRNTGEVSVYATSHII